VKEFLKSANISQSYETNIEWHFLWLTVYPRWVFSNFLRHYCVPQNPTQHMSPVAIFLFFCLLVLSIVASLFVCLRDQHVDTENKMHCSPDFVTEDQPRTDWHWKTIYSECTQFSFFAALCSLASSRQSIARLLLSCGVWLAGRLSRSCIVSKRLKIRPYSCYGMRTGNRTQLSNSRPIISNDP